MADLEKHVVTHEGQEEYKGSMSSQDNSVDLTPAEAKRVIRKLDGRLVVTTGLMYCISLMDRTNLSNAAIAGMMQELKLVEYRYSIITLVFFIPYVLFQPPATVLARKIGPRIFLSFLTLSWGAIMIGMGFTKKWEQMAGLRVLLGVLEAGFFPGCVYLLSTWYVRYDMGKRYSLFYLLGCVASAFAGILAYGLMQMNGIQGLTGWRWIFIIEGCLTAGIGMIGYVFLVGFPDDDKRYWGFLSHRETQWVLNRVNADRGDAVVEPFQIGKFLSAGLDIKIWGYAMIFFDSTTLAYALAYFLPIILREGLGFSVAEAQCLGAPPYVFAGIVMFASAWVGDRYRIRGPIIIFNMILCLIGLPIMGWHKNAAVRYFGVFLVTAGANANVPAVMTYQANNIRGQWKRAFCSATLVGMGGVGGIAGSLVFRSQDKPHYHPGMYACIACSLLSCIITALLMIRCNIENKQADRGEKVLEGADDGFRYTL